MKTLIFIITLLLTLPVIAQSKFSKPIPKPTAVALVGGAPIKKSEWRPIISIPALKISKSVRDNSIVDTQLLTSTGGGVSWQMLEYDPITEKWKSNFSFSPATILITGDTSGTSSLDISYATTIGFFNNLIMIGAGYDLGNVEGRNRLFGLISIGINLNN
jgi:hypothetical protein